MKVPKRTVVLLGALVLGIAGICHGAEKEKKVVIHIPTNIKHIHHHHSNKMTPHHKGRHGFSLSGGSGGFGHAWQMMKGLERGKQMEDLLEGHSSMHGGHDHIPWLHSKDVHATDHGKYHKGKFAHDMIFSSRHVGKHRESWPPVPTYSYGGKGHAEMKEIVDPSPMGKGSSNWRVVKDHVEDISVSDLLKGKYSTHGSSSVESSVGPWQKYKSHEEHLLYPSSGSKYEVKETSEEDMETPIFLSSDGYGGSSGGSWQGSKGPVITYEMKEPVMPYKPKSPTVSSYEVKGHKGSSYSSVTLHNPKSRRQV